MRDIVQALRITGIVVGLLFALSFAWVVLIGPAVMLALHPR